MPVHLRVKAGAGKITSLLSSWKSPKINLKVYSSYYLYKTAKQ
jgi:hypothetical protein